MDLNNVNIVKVRKAKEEDIKEIALNIRESEKQELWDIDHLTPEKALRISFKNSPICWTVTRLEKPVAIFGVGEPNICWMICTKEFSKLNNEFLKRSKEFINIMLESYPVLENYVSVDNIPSIKWLSFCGAKLESPAPYGIENKMFHKFTFIKEYTKTYGTESVTKEIYA